MKKIAVFLLMAAFIMPGCRNRKSEPASANHTVSEDVSGSWIGTLQSKLFSLRVVFNVSRNADHDYSATLDSPDQGAMGIPVDSLNVKGNEIAIYVSSLNMRYSGEIGDDNMIRGKFWQNGGAWPLNLSRLDAPFSNRKPQEPVPPYPYDVEEVTFYNPDFDINLSGTLTIPRNIKGKCKAVVMITGSGAQNRDEEIFGHKPFMVIADYLTRHGIAVLRYDDRGIGGSEGGSLPATSFDFATDVEAALAYLRNNPRIAPEKTGLIGHSEGGLIASIVASRDSTVAFIVSLAGTGVSGKQVSLRQNEDLSHFLKISQRKIRKNNEMNSAIFDMIIHESDNEIAMANVEGYLRNFFQKRLIFKKLVDAQIKASMSSITVESLPWLRCFLSTDPAVLWKKVACPVLALNGDKDVQVAADVNLPAIENALKQGGNSMVTTHLMPGLNHLFQHCVTGNTSEYSTIDETFSPEVLDIMADWINKQGDF